MASASPSRTGATCSTSAAAAACACPASIAAAAFACASSACAPTTRTAAPPSPSPEVPVHVRKAILAALIALAVPATAHADAPGTTLTGSGPTFSFSSTEPGVTFECAVDGGAFTACVSPYTVQLADGPHTFAVRAVDRAGNADPTPATRDIDIDTSGIETTIDAGPEGLTNDPTPTYAFSTTTTSASYECRI